MLKRLIRRLNPPVNSLVKPVPLTRFKTVKLIIAAYPSFVYLALRDGYGWRTALSFKPFILTVKEYKAAVAAAPGGGYSVNAGVGLYKIGSVYDFNNWSYS